MAPLSPSVAYVTYELIPRGLGTQNMTADDTLTPSQSNTLQILALVFATISISSAILSFYWFVKMRRSFRHDLIMLLIQSDMFKALWFMVYPIVTFSSGPVQSNSKFCQVNGFFLAWGIEASDIAILMIAIHSALYIFKPRSGSGEGGLYPYRHIAYVSWAIIPIILASLAFINDGDAYILEGTYCYLPVRPFWYRLALAWIPRYLIFIFILCIYASIYYYVRYKFSGFTKLSKHHSAGSADNSGEHQRRNRRSIPPTPPLQAHGLIQLPEEARKQSESTMDSYKVPISPDTNAHRFMWSSFLSRSTTEPILSEPSTEEDSFAGPSTPQPLQFSLTIPSITDRSSLPSPSQSRLSSWQDNFVTRFSISSGSPNSKRSMANIFDVLNHKPGDTESPTPISQLRLINSRGQDVAVSEMLRTRDKIRRQLRFLFIYPLVYIGMWILPFISHVLQYDDKFAVNPPFGLTCVTTIFICSQAAVDCWLFSTREKPWRHIPGTDGGFFSSLRFWENWKGFKRAKVTAGPGRTRDEMAREASAAYRRREQELVERRNTVLETAKKGERSWWEIAGLDGPSGMSPLAEEVSNPMDRALIASPESRKESGSVQFKIPVKNGEVGSSEAHIEEGDGTNT